MAELERRTLWAGSNPLVLPPKSKRFLIGSMAKFENNTIALAVGGYRTRHFHLQLAMETMAEEEGYGKMAYEWLGELEVVNDYRFATVGEIKLVNPVAGLWVTTIAPLLGNANSSGTFLQTMRDYYPALCHRRVKKLSYKDAMKQDKEHLMKRTQRFVRAFRRLQQEEKIPHTETYRHYIGNRIGTVLNDIAMILGAGTLDEKDISEAIRKRFEKDLTFESLYLYLTWLENDGVTHASIEPMKKLLHKFNKEKALTIEEWRMFDKLADKFRSFVFGPDESDEITLEEWMAFGGFAEQFLELVNQLQDPATSAGATQIIVINQEE